MMRAATSRGIPGAGPAAAVRIAAAVILLAAFAAASARAEEPAGSPAPAPAAPPGGAAAPSFRNDYALLLGFQYWDRVDDFDPAIPAGATGRAGRFEPLGFDIEGSYHRRVARWLGWDVLPGADAGFFHHGNKEDYDVTLLPSGRRIGGRLSARGFYAMPSVKLFSGEPAPWRFSLGAGAGLVLVDIANSLDDGMTVDRYFREEALGGYLSAGADRILKRSSMSILLRLEAKALFVDFGSLGEFAPGAGRLAGPVFLFQAGIAVAD